MSSVRKIATSAQYYRYIWHAMDIFAIAITTLSLCDDAVSHTFLCLIFYQLAHWGRATYICVGKLTTIVSDNGLSPGRRQAIIWTNAGILLIGPLGTNFSEILIEIYTFSFKKINLKVSSGKWRPSCLGLNVLIAVCCRRCYRIVACKSNLRCLGGFSFNMMTPWKHFPRC